MNRHPDTWLTREQLGTRAMKYQPTYDFPTQHGFIDGWHKNLANSAGPDKLTIRIKNRPIVGKYIDGWLQVADALKLYEMAYYAPGDILELGSYHGLSTYVMAKALKASRQPKRILTVDLAPECVAATAETLRSAGLGAYATSSTADAASAVRASHEEGRRFAFAFVDHSHAYQPVYEVCVELPTVMTKGGFCLFHDFNDPRNRNPEDLDYGVYQAVIDGLDSQHFDFYGVYGCCALYRVR
jgi:predicted O-methyltransferase YrrM